MAPYLSIRVLLLNGGVSLRFVEPAIWALHAVISHRAVARSGRGCQRSSGPRLVKASVYASEHSSYMQPNAQRAASITVLSANAPLFVTWCVSRRWQTSAIITSIAAIAATHVMVDVDTRELSPARLRSSADHQDQGLGAAIDLRGFLLLDLGSPVRARLGLALPPSSASLACLASPLFAHSRSQSALPASPPVVPQPSRRRALLTPWCWQEQNYRAEGRPDECRAAHGH